MKPLLLFVLLVVSLSSHAQDVDFEVEGVCVELGNLYTSPANGFEPIYDQSLSPAWVITQVQGDYQYCKENGYLFIPKASSYDLLIEAALNPPTSGTGSSSDVVTAIDNSTLNIVTALACLCFFVGLNSWETSAK